MTIYPKFPYRRVIVMFFRMASKMAVICVAYANGTKVYMFTMLGTTLLALSRCGVLLTCLEQFV